LIFSFRNVALVAEGMAIFFARIVAKNFPDFCHRSARSVVGTNHPEFYVPLAGDKGLQLMVFVPSLDLMEPYVGPFMI
jgi:hypothetical protein